MVHPAELLEDVGTQFERDRFVLKQALVGLLSELVLALNLEQMSDMKLDWKGKKVTEL